LFSRNGGCEHLLFVGRDVIHAINRAIVDLHIWEGELLWHFDESDEVYER